MSRLPKYETKIFTDLYDNADDFLTDWKASGLYESGLIADTSITKLYYLLYAKYAGSPIANWDENQFKYKMWGVIFQYGPSWEKRLSIQSTLRGLSESDLTTGARAINAHAYAMGDDTPTEINAVEKIDQKSSTNYTKTKMDAYSQLWDLLATDVTTEFINKFKVCFKQFVMPEHPTLYVTEIEDGEDEDE